jgi:hypothetical protein
MFQFSEARLGLEFCHLSPGRYDCRHRAPLPVWNGPSGCASPLPPLNPHDLRLAWDAEAPLLVARRSRRGAPRALPSWVWTPVPAPACSSLLAGEDARSGGGSDLSVDCGECSQHVSRHRRATQCDACSYVLCRTCHPVVGSDFSCPVCCPVASLPSPKRCRQDDAPPLRRPAPP